MHQPVRLQTRAELKKLTMFVSAASCTAEAMSFFTIVHTKKQNKNEKQKQKNKTNKEVKGNKDPSHYGMIDQYKLKLSESFHWPYYLNSG